MKPPSHLPLVGQHLGWSGLVISAAVLVTSACGRRGHIDVDAPPGGDAVDAVDCDADVSSCEYTGRRLTVMQREAGTITDPETGRVLPLYVRFPTGPGPYPIVIWSHSGPPDDSGHHLNEVWGDTIAAGGYIVVHVAHVTLTGPTATAVCTFAAIPSGECVPGTDPLDDEAPWVTVIRPRDVITLLDQLPMLATGLANNGGPMADTSKVAVVGWSGGTRAPFALLGAARYLTPSIPSYKLADPRPVATVALSPAGVGYFGFFAGPPSSWAGMRGPMLIMTGDNDLKPEPPGLIGAIRRQSYDMQPADGTRRLLYSTLPSNVGQHTTYNLADLGSTDARLDRLSRALRSTMLAFLDSTVRGEAAATTWLESDIAGRLAGDAEWSKK